VSTWRDRMKHAFAVDPPGPQEPTPAQFAPLDRICRRIAESRMALPGIVALEMARPLVYLSSQLMHGMSPVIWAMARKESFENYRLIAEFLERRGSVEWICRRIEWYEEHRDHAPRDEGDAQDEKRA